MNEPLMKEMLSKKIWAVVGATPNKEKTGYKIVQRLLAHGYKVYCVNPNYEQIDDLKCYKNIDVLPVVPDCIDFVVPPKVTKKAIDNLDSEKVKFLWLQPGSYSEDTPGFAEEKGFKVVHEGACVMMAVEVIDELD